MNEPTSPVRPYKFGSTNCTTLAELARALRDSWDQGRDHLAGGYVGKWLEDELRDYDAKIALDALLQSDLGADHALFVFAATHDPDNPPVYKGIEISYDSLRTLANDVNPEGLDKRRFLLDLFRDRILGAAAKLRRDNRLADIERRWRDEVINYFIASAEFLSYDEIWNNEPGILQFNLGPPEGELFVYDNFADGQRNEQAVDLLATSVKERLFDYLFADDSEDLPNDFRIENQTYQDALKRAWFSAMDREDARSIGRDEFLKGISAVAAIEFDSLNNRIEALEEERRSPKVEDWPLKLEQKGSAAAYGGLMYLSYLSIGGDSQLMGMALISQIVLTFYIVTLNSTPKIGRSTSSIVGKSIGIYFLLILLVVPIAIILTIFDSAFVNTVTFGGAFAFLGWIREPILKIRLRKRIDQELATLRSSIAGSSERIRSRDYIASLLVLTSQGISRAEALATNRQNAGYGAAYTGSTQSAVIQKAQKSRVAANHGDGVSFGALGMNYASDGTLTTEIMDGVSIDSKGGMNTRLFDGVTLHSDGKYTTEVTKGIEIRSDGQVTTEIAGFRFSSGGKEKKKDEWDWGTGKKKEKGWFD